MLKEHINPPDAAPPSVAYSNAVVVPVGDARMVFVTGQIALDPSGVLVSDDIAEQARYVFVRVSLLLNLAGASIDDVVSSQLYLTDMNEAGPVLKVRNEFYAKAKPASLVVEVARLAHEDCRVELAVTAVAASPPSS